MNRLVVALVALFLIAVPACGSGSESVSGEPWDVLFLADRSDPMISDTVVELYLQRTEDAMGVETAALPSEGLYPDVEAVLKSLRGEWEPDFSVLVPQAEVIVVQTWPRATIRAEDFHRCVQGVATGWPPEPAEFEQPEYWTVYQETLGEIYEEIWRLRDGGPTLLIGIDSYNAMVSRQVEYGTATECRQFWEKWSDVQREVAEAHGAIWVSLHDAINGPNHEVDGGKAGYLGSTELTPAIAFYSPNEVGAGMIADALSTAGFDLTTQP